MPYVAHTQAKPQFALPKEDDDKQQVLEYTELVFGETFGFPFPPSDSFSPPGASTPANLRISEKEATLYSALPGDIIEFLKSAFGDLHLPSWLQVDSQKDVLKLSSTILEEATDQWQFVSLAKVYTPSDLTTASPIKVDAIVAFFTGIHDLPGGPVQTTELGVAVVCYDLLLSTDWTKFHLRQSAYRAASTVLADGKKAVGDDKSLANIATAYSKLEFSRDFSYQWDQAPPDFVSNRKYTLSKNTALGFFEDGEVEKVKEKAKSFVENKILQGVSVPTWAEGAVVPVLADTISTALTLEPNTRSWLPRKFDQSYDDPRGKDGSLRISGVLMYFTTSHKLLNNRIVQIAYVFWLGQTYTIPALKTSVYNDMIKELYKNLSGSMNKVPTSGLLPDRAGLLELLKRCGASKFQSDHGYKFNGDTTRPRTSNGDEVYSVVAFAEFDAVTEAVISNWTTENIFGPDTFSFFSTVPTIQSDLNDRIGYWLTQNALTTRNNRWGISKFPKSYNHPSSNSKALRGEATIFYANGTKVAKGIQLSSNIVYFVGVYYVVDIMGDESDDGAV